MQLECRDSTCADITGEDFEKEFERSLLPRRFAAKSSSEPEAAAEAAVAQLLSAAEARRQGRPEGNAAWRPAPPLGNRGGPAGPNQAVQRLHALYSADTPPPINTIRHPQVCPQGAFGTFKAVLQHFGISLPYFHLHIIGWAMICFTLRWRAASGALGCARKNVLGKILDCACWRVAGVQGALGRPVHAGRAADLRGPRSTRGTARPGSCRSR